MPATSTWPFRDASLVIWRTAAVAAEADGLVVDAASVTVPRELDQVAFHHFASIAKGNRHG
jgi:hypothetical protein